MAPPAPMPAFKAVKVTANARCCTSGSGLTLASMVWNAGNDGPNDAPSARTGATAVGTLWAQASPASASACPASMLARTRRAPNLSSATPVSGVAIRPTTPEAVSSKPTAGRAMSLTWCR